MNVSNKTKENIGKLLFILMALFFILGVTLNVIFIYIALFILLVDFIISDGLEGGIYIGTILLLTVISLFVIDYFEAKGIYIIIALGIISVIFFIYKEGRKRKKSKEE